MAATDTPGPRNAITDVPGVRVGHARLPGDRSLSGTTVVLVPPGGAVAAVDVRGSGPGTRETDALEPGNLVQRVDAVVLTGGSAYGLAAADGVAAWLEEAGRGHPMGSETTHVVPVVPTAALFDLRRGGDFRARPDASTGRAAVMAAAASEQAGPVPQGSVGAGTGAMTAGMKGGVGTASVRLADGTTVAALVAVNALGSTVDPATGLPYAFGDGLRLPDGRPEFPLRVPGPAAAERARLRLAELSAERDLSASGSTLNTTLGVIATDACLNRSRARKLAGAAHDGMARAVRPCHTLFDGDTVFALATGTRSAVAASDQEVNGLIAAAADVFARAVVHAVLSAESVTTPWGHLPAYRELYPEAFDARAAWS
ncbi:P1 family peptidase [Peterkaempfera sp. SMS 1(5)a]|uniref:P1 family peptidase n=1 Tax=Peterkaempfera podocarpi TaxID=3232308 RepID=UPI003671CD3F